MGGGKQTTGGSPTGKAKYQKKAAHMEFSWNPPARKGANAGDTGFFQGGCDVQQRGNVANQKNKSANFKK